MVNNNHLKNVLDVFAGMLIGGVTGAVTMLLLAPQSGEKTRMQIQKKGVDLLDQASKMLDDGISQLQSDRKQLTRDGREKVGELVHHSQNMVVEQLDHLSEAAQAGKKAILNS